MAIEGYFFIYRQIFIAQSTLSDGFEALRPSAYAMMLLWKKWT